LNRLAWLRDRITQMGHPPHLYERWQAEIDLLEEGSTPPSKSQRRRRRAFAAAGLPGELLPPGLIYAHGAVMTEAEARVIGDRMDAMGPRKPPTGSARYYQLAAEHLRNMRRSARPLAAA